MTLSEEEQEVASLARDFWITLTLEDEKCCSKTLSDLKHLAEAERHRFMFEQPRDLEGGRRREGGEGMFPVGPSPIAKAWSNGLNIQFTFVISKHCGGNIGVPRSKLEGKICLKLLVWNGACYIDNHAKTGSTRRVGLGIKCPSVVWESTEGFSKLKISPGDLSRFLTFDGKRLEDARRLAPMATEGVQLFYIAS